MPNPMTGNLVSLCRSTVKLTFNRSFSSCAVVAAAKAINDSLSDIVTESSTGTCRIADAKASYAVLESYITSIECSSSISSELDSANRILRSFKAPPSSSVSTSGGSELDSDCDDENESGGNVLEMPWLAKMDYDMTSLQRKDAARNKRQSFAFKITQTSRFGHLVRTCADSLGTDATMQVLEKLGCKEYNAFIRTCIEKARDATDEVTSLQLIDKAYQISKQMRENGFKIEEETSGKLMLYLIDFGMVEEFFLFYELIQDENPDSVTRLAYYEMLLWLRLNNKEKLQELFNSAVANGAEEKYFLQEQLLLALCESGRKKELLMLLEIIDVSKVTSVADLVCLFRSIGKFMVECFVERCLLALKTNGIASDDLSKLICEYAISIPNLAVKDIIIKFRALHAKMEVSPTSAQYERLVKYSCQFRKVRDALDLVDDAFEYGGAISFEAFHAMINACYQTRDLNLVHQINSRMRCHSLRRYQLMMRTD